MHAMSKPLAATPRMSGVALVLRAEGLGMLAMAATLYGFYGFSWWTFAFLLLVPDLLMVGYLVSARVGSITYNLAHTTLWPIGLVLVGLILAQPLALQLGLIWLAHIGMDRALGYGVKYASSFQDTHLQRV